MSNLPGGCSVVLFHIMVHSLVLQLLLLLGAGVPALGVVEAGAGHVHVTQVGRQVGRDRILNNDQSDPS